MRLCFASNNAHKLDEIRPLLPPHITLLSLADIGCTEELPETQDTLEGNARQKADYVRDHYGVACFADDTGLEVTALHGAPGVYSARYAGPQRLAADNVAKLLDELDAMSHRYVREQATRFARADGWDGDGPVQPWFVRRAIAMWTAEGRQARFRTVVAFARTGHETLLFSGELLGHIAENERGTNGFGYDPVFAPTEGDGRTFAEMSGVEKNQISHRARAVAALVEHLSFNIHHLAVYAHRLAR